jgi:hypothetical protein
VVGTGLLSWEGFREVMCENSLLKHNSYVNGRKVLHILGKYGMSRFVHVGEHYPAINQKAKTSKRRLKEAYRIEVDKSVVKVPSIALITTTTIRIIANKVMRIPNMRLIVYENHILRKSGKQD